ncbi:cobalamin biosynthesis protein [Defluviimonas sp. WL0075]|uniref:Cobalamin biosynthesis protein n=1 Tax=Albidovulum sediminicola TaxID=2984331 RepID=A0ABT2YYL8_9RHOB|nr:cobalamin biosynthesis protein [Defluviimonas sp. WL0075]MCV2863987.1 cobalamin biosynthesis protein [Defluviimonas sp. WL0075]
MRVAGVGFRGAATPESLIDAVTRAGGGAGLLATAEEKSGAAALQEAARRMGLSVRTVGRADLAAQQVPTRSARVAERFGTGSLAEAAALAAAGPGARLLGPRVVSGDGLATAAIAIGRDE